MFSSCLWAFICHSVSPYFSITQPLTTVLFTKSMSLVSVDSRYEQNSYYFICAWVISLYVITSKYIHVSTNIQILKFFCLKHIPLCFYTTFFLAIDLSVDTLVDSTPWLLWTMLQKTQERERRERESIEFHILSSERINVRLYIPCSTDFIYFGHIPQKRVAKSTVFNFLSVLSG